MSDPAWEQMLSRACAGDGLTSHYQPIVDVARGSVVGYEALVRFVDYPVTDPEVWFAVAREHGCVAALEAAALRSALVARRSLPTNAFLTVNLGPDVLDDPEVQSVLHTQGSLAGLVIELTEHAQIESYVALEPALDRLRGDGALIALDAGSGYAGLTHMLNIRPSIIKLDRALICGLDRNEAKQALVEMMGTLGGRLDAWLLAEGVETRAELDTLVRLGVPLVQGYHLARPAPAWATIQTDTALHLLTSGARDEAGTTLRSLLDDAMTATSMAESRRWFERDDVDLVVVLDEHNRPSCTVDAAGLVRAMTDTLRFNLDTPVAEAALRAVARPLGMRAHPLVCTDNAGRYVGVVRMENVVKWLAGQADTQPHHVVGRTG